MNLQRLKFALARGARIQCNSQQGHADWTSVENPSWFNWVNYRIHPDDAHLEYGPLSSALREDSMYFGTDITPYLVAAMEYIEEICWRSDPEFARIADTFDTTEALMGQLFFAEMLADEGL